MQAFASTTVSNFPNLFLINGPNTSSGHNSALIIIEAQIDYILGALEYARAHRLAALEPKPEAEREYAASIDSAAANTVWVSGGCHNWYVDPRSGRLTLIWPDYAYGLQRP